MQRTLLQVCQEYLDATSGFYVDSIYDTDESQQVAKLAERVYYKMVQEFPNLLFTMKEMTLDSLSDATRPNYMLLPKDIQKVQESKIFYNVSITGKTQYKEIQYLSPLKFIEMTNATEGEDTLLVEGFDENKMVVPKIHFLLIVHLLIISTWCLIHIIRIMIRHYKARSLRLWLQVKKYFIKKMTL